MALNNFILVIGSSLKIGFITSSGRNFSGKICTFHRGGNINKYRYLVDHFRRINCFGFISKIIETPFYSSGLVLIIYKNGLSSYVLAPEKFAVKDLFYSGSVLFKAKAKVGYSIPIGYVNLFSRISNVEKYPFRGSIIARSAGTSMLLTNKSGGRISIKLKSGWNLLLSAHCICTVGPTSSSNIKFVNIKKAGLSRSLGFRPVVRGVAMNPCDHPHGGGEGKKSPPASSRSPWGWLTKGGVSTVKKKHSKMKKKIFKVSRK